MHVDWVQGNLYFNNIFVVCLYSCLAAGYLFTKIDCGGFTLTHLYAYLKCLSGTTTGRLASAFVIV